MRSTTPENDGRIPWLILLSGTTSSGKTTLAKALQQQLSTPKRPFLNIEADRLLPHLPEVWPQEDVQMASTMSRALHRAIIAFADQGFDLIIDGVLPYGRAESMKDAFSVFNRYRLCYVGVHCQIEVLEQRESKRTDRQAGWACQQYDRLHVGAVYDVEVDTTFTSVEANARIIASYVSEQDSGFQRLV